MDEVNFQPGWLRRDVARAAKRMDEWFGGTGMERLRERDELLEKLSAAIDETLYAYSHGMMSEDMAKESILALLTAQAGPVMPETPSEAFMAQDTSSRAVSRYDHADDALYLSRRSNPDA